MNYIKNVNVIETVPAYTVQQALKRAQKENDRIRENQCFWMDTTHAPVRSFTRPNDDRNYVKIMKAVRRTPGATRKALIEAAGVNDDSTVWTQLVKAGLITYTRTGGQPFVYNLSNAGHQYLNQLG